MLIGRVVQWDCAALALNGICKFKLTTTQIVDTHRLHVPRLLFLVATMASQLLFFHVRLAQHISVIGEDVRGLKVDDESRAFSCPE